MIKLKKPYKKSGKPDAGKYKEDKIDAKKVYEAINDLRKKVDALGSKADGISDLHKRIENLELTYDAILSIEKPIDNIEWSKEGKKIMNNLNKIPSGDFCTIDATPEMPSISYLELIGYTQSALRKQKEKGSKIKNA